MDQKVFGNSTDQINSTFESDTVGPDAPVEKDVRRNGTTTIQAISFADSDSMQHSTGAVKALVEIVIPHSHDVSTETCLNNDAHTHKSMVNIKCSSVYYKVEFSYMYRHLMNLK